MGKAEAFAEAEISATFRYIPEILYLSAQDKTRYF
jgi:hypothetical protein